MEGKFNRRESWAGRGPGEEESNSGTLMDGKVLCKLQNPFHSEINPLMRVVKSTLSISLWLRPRKAEIYKAREAFGYIFRLNLFVQREQEVYTVFMPSKARDCASLPNWVSHLLKFLPSPARSTELRVGTGYHPYPGGSSGTSLYSPGWAWFQELKHQALTKGEKGKISVNTWGVHPSNRAEWLDSSWHDHLLSFELLHRMEKRPTCHTG